MSARKSWDIAPKRSGASAAPTPRRTRSVEMTRAATPRTTKPPPPRMRRAPARSARQSPLRTKRREERKAAGILFFILALVVFGILLYVLWLPALRVQEVTAEGPDTEGIAAVARGALEGRAYGVFPKNSIFLVPEEDIRSRVLEAYPSIQAVSISATGLNTLTVKALMRSNAFVWCGESYEARSETCYEADAGGLIFAPHTVASSTATTSAELLVYGPLEGVTGDTPVRAHVTYASALPGALKFIKAMRGLGADIGSVTLRGDEVDLHTKTGTRITYVIGKEGEAAVLAATAFPSLDLNDGSIEYVDLRFANKVYLKRRGEAPTE